MLEDLLEETRCILSDVEKETGRPVRVVPGEQHHPSRTALSEGYRAQDLNAIRIHYNTKALSIDYAVAHEAIRRLRFLKAAPEQRLVLGSNQETRTRAYGRLEQDLNRHPDRLRKAVREIQPILYDGILTQLMSMPSDFWIHQYLKEHYVNEQYPRFSAALQKGVDANVRVCHRVLAEPSMAMFPQTLYIASNAMNAAFAGFMAELMEKPEYARPYLGTPFQALGTRLRELNPSEQGHPGDRAATDHWAEALGLKGWYVWTKMENEMNALLPVRLRR